MKKDESMSRRDFLEKAGAAAAGLSLAGPVKSLMAQGITGETGESPPSVQSPSGSGAIITVIKNGLGDYDNIQDAIDAAVNGDTIQVWPGIYDEGIDFLGKAITVEGKVCVHPVMAEPGVEVISLPERGVDSATDTWLTLAESSASVGSFNDSKVTLTIQFTDSDDTSNDEGAIDVVLDAESSGTTYSLADVVSEINLASQALGWSPEGKDLRYDAAETYYDFGSGKYLLRLCSRESTSDDYSMVLAGINTLVEGAIGATGGLTVAANYTSDTVSDDMQAPTSVGVVIKKLAAPVIAPVSNDVGVSFLISQSHGSELKNFLIINTVKAISVSPASTPKITNVTAINNDYGVYTDDGSPDISNSIFWGNNDDLYGCQARYSCIEDGDAGEGNISAAPQFAYGWKLKSQGGRLDSNNEQWVQDTVTSPCIDAGDPDSPIGDEPFPNGGQINMGAFGGSPLASKSYFGSPPCPKHVAGDVNGDCVVNFKDLAFVARDWLKNNSP